MYGRGSLREVIGGLVWAEGNFFLGKDSSALRAGRLRVVHSVEFESHRRDLSGFGEPS
jgi:hypothetical protein